MSAAPEFREFAPLESYEFLDNVRVSTRKKQDAKASTLQPIELRHIADIVAEKREVEWLLYQVVEACVLAVLVGPRGMFKSFIALHWAILMATENHAGVILSGEGAGLGRRIEAWLNRHAENLDIGTLPLVAVERPMNLTSDEVIKALREAIRGLPSPPKFIVIDTFSKYSAGLDENDNSEVAAFLSSLAELRDELRCTVLIVAHTGHGDRGRPRGASTLMCNPDAEYVVSRPDAAEMTVTVTRERFKDSPSLPPLAYEAKVVDLGRLDRYGDPVTSLALEDVDAPPPSAKGRGRNQEKFATALKEWKRNHPDVDQISSIDIEAIFKTQKVIRQRRREVLNSFVNSKAFTHSVGGYLVDWKLL
jgi:AAA domain-containing protein